MILAPETIDPCFLVGEARLDAIAEVVNAHWPETIEPAQLDDPALWARIRTAGTALLETLDLAELL